jgi:hypothetical protein
MRCDAYIFIHTYIHTYIHRYIDTYTYIHTHTHTRTHMHTLDIRARIRHRTETVRQEYHAHMSPSVRKQLLDWKLPMLLLGIMDQFCLVTVHTYLRHHTRSGSQTQASQAFQRAPQTCLPCLSTRLRQAAATTRQIPKAQRQCF